VKRAVLLIATALLFGASAQPALAAWTSAGTGSASGKAQQLASGAQPTLSVSGQQVTVSWNQISVLGSRVGALPGGGYTVTRYATGSSTPITPAAGCAGTQSGSAAQLSCTESSVPEGSWRYTVTPLLRNWRGSESALSTSAVVDVTAPTVTLTAPANNAWTNNQKPTTSGAAGTATGDLPTITVKIYAGATATGTPVQTLTTTASAGAYSVAPSSNLAAGTYTAQASQTDSAGNTGLSSARTFIVDITPPAVTVNSTCTTIGHGASQTASVSGVAGILSGDSTSITVVIYNGTGTGGTVFQTQTITASGATWSAGSNTLTNHATYTVQATQTDAAGNTGISGTCTFSA
jgi:hypothetical protein